MASYSLTPVSPLEGFENTWGDLSLKEVTDVSVVSLAIPLDGEKTFQEFLDAEFGFEVVAPGKSNTKKGMTLLGLARDQFFLKLPFSENPVTPGLLESAKGRVYLTDQSDSWAHLLISGAGVRSALERICPINLHTDKFAIGDLARTSMEHMNALIWRVDQNSFHLMCARSSAQTFLHAVVTSIENTLSP